MKEETIVIDATGAAMGRVASFAAKQALFGKKVIIVNCNDAIVIGKKNSVVQTFKRKRARGGSSMKGPNYPRNSERIMKRTVRGMLPYTQERGLSALKRTLCYNTVPQEYASAEKITLFRPLKIKPIKLSLISKEL